MSGGARDDVYLDIIDGLARYTGDPLIEGVRRAVREYPTPALANALNKNQMASKRWLVEELHRAAGTRLGTVYVVGGWYGVLGAMLLARPGLEVDRVVSVDIDPGCVPVARCLNRDAARGGRFLAVTADMHHLDYSSSPPDVVINTSTEHLPDPAGWYARVPAGCLVAVQSNDLFGEPDHVNCVSDLESFRALVPMGQCLYAGSLPLKRYTRFMLIGRK